MDEHLDMQTGIKDAIPTMLGYIGIGLAFGIVSKAAGLDPFTVFLLSTFVYAGSAQFIIVGLLSSLSPTLSIVLATLLVNSRLLLLSMTVAPYFKQDSMVKNILIGTLLTDETFSLGMNKVNYSNDQLTFGWYNTANILSYLSWITFSVLGAVVGEYIGDPNAFGLDFAMVGMFIGLLYLRFISDNKTPRSLQLLVISFTFLLVYVGLIFIPSNLLILVVTLLGCTFGVVIKHAFF
ncbi:AzlC family ABC transporter permease [Lacticigenium naphthae]|uniref:AzlC family ABC transporter permease n=1 Tax=Lacticigenium naphthae TaxID=515351 RepID=UPI00040161F3|nr:AzlC family ABC transporter permease [Lacticigenium naphthae]